MRINDLKIMASPFDYCSSEHKAAFQIDRIYFASTENSLT